MVFLILANMRLCGEREHLTIVLQTFSPNIHTVRNSFNPGMIPHTFLAERLDVIAKLLH